MTLPWKLIAKKKHRLLKSELSGSRKLYLKLVEETRRRIALDRRSEMINLDIWTPGTWAFTQLGSRVLAVVVRRIEGWCMYVDAVPGNDHIHEAPVVLDHGNKLDEGTATAILKHRFHPGIEPGGAPYIL